MGAQALELLGEDAVGAQQRLDAHGGGDVGGLEQALQVHAGQHEHAEHAVGAVDQRQALLGAQFDRADPGLVQGGVGGQVPPGGVADPALAHQGQRHVRQGRQVPRAAQAAVLVHDRGDAGVEQRGEGLGGGDLHAGVARGQGAQAQQHEGAHDLVLHLGSGPGGVRADERTLEAGPQVGGDVAGGERAEAGADPVGGDLAAGERLDPFAAVVEGLSGLLGQGDTGAVAGHVEDLGRGERRIADDDGRNCCGHASHLTPRVTPGEGLTRGFHLRSQTIGASRRGTIRA